MSNEHHYNVLLAPVITEKATMLSEENKVVFSVPVAAGKKEILEAVEALFKVNVVRVNTIRTRGKIKKFRGRLGRRKDEKKAVVTLKEGQSIDIAAGL